MTSAAAQSAAKGVSATASAPERTPEERLAAAFADHVVRWALEQGADLAAQGIVQRAASLVSRAVSAGHSCLGLDEFANALQLDGSARPAISTLRTQLLASRVVGTPENSGAMPLIVDTERLYLHRYFDYECRLAANLAARAGYGPRRSAENTPSVQVIALLDRMFTAASSQPGMVNWQKIAAITALLDGLTVISGGPGTGKTTTVVSLLACLLEAEPDCRIALTAPTGKAAARMTEVMLQRAAHLSEPMLHKLPRESSTIHRLLGVMPDGRFRHHAHNLLPIDVLVVDEASMLDLGLAVRLFEAVPAAARIILLGDKDQLAAVESGAVFSELSAMPVFTPERIEMLSRLGGFAPQALQSVRYGGHETYGTGNRLRDSVIWLQHNYRFAAGSAIGLLARDINAGNAAGVLTRLEEATDVSLVWINEGGSAPSRASMHAIMELYADYIEAVRKHAADPRLIAAAFAHGRVLCALRDGPWGVNSLNQEISTQFRRNLQHPLDPGLRSEWYPGRPVMVLRNDPVLKLFNGDIGIALHAMDGALQLWFPDDAGGFRAIPPARLPEHETAFAMSVHKSQGSEFAEVFLVLPAVKSRVVSRELFYTAVTRARERLTLVAGANTVVSAIDAVTKRVSGLTSRLRDADKAARAGP